MNTLRYFLPTCSTRFRHAPVYDSDRSALVFARHPVVKLFVLVSFSFLPVISAISGNRLEGKWWNIRSFAIPGLMNSLATMQQTWFTTDRSLIPYLVITPCFVTPCLITPCFITPCVITPRFITPRFITPHFITPRFIAPRFIAPRFITPRFITPCFITPVYVLLLHSIPCFIICLVKGVKSKNAPDFASRMLTPRSRNKNQFCDYMTTEQALQLDKVSTRPVQPGSCKQVLI